MAAAGEQSRAGSCDPALIARVASKTQKRSKPELEVRFSYSRTGTRIPATPYAIFLGTQVFDGASFNFTTTALVSLVEQVQKGRGRSIIRHILSSSSAMTTEVRSSPRRADTRRLRHLFTSRRARRTSASQRLMDKRTAARALSHSASL